jgi:hypothetical protein
MWWGPGLLTLHKEGSHQEGMTAYGGWIFYLSKEDQEKIQQQK